MKITDSVARIRKILDKAFDSVAYPGDDHIALNQANDWEAGSVAEHWKGKHWRRMDCTADIVPHADTLPLLTAQAFVYFLPAFLKDALLQSPEPNGYRSLCADYLLMILEPPSANGSFAPIFFERLQLMTKAQKSAVLTFLEYYVTVFPDDFGWADEVAAKMISFWRNAIDFTY